MNTLECSPEAVVTVTMTRPLRPPVGTVATMVDSFFMVNAEA